MGYIEETGAAQFFRDARITPIYEGTNGIQAADLVGRKLGLSNGAAFATLIADMRAEAEDAALRTLIDACDEVGRRLATADADDRLAASYPFLTMLSVAVCGWLMERQGRVAADGDDDFLPHEARGRALSMSSRSCPRRWACTPRRPRPPPRLYELPADLFAA